MVQKSITANKQPNWLIIGIIALIGAFIFFQPFIGIICIAALISYIFFPMYSYISKYIPRYFAATLTMFITFATVIIPVSAVIIFAINQGAAFANSLSELNITPNSTIGTSLQSVINPVNSITTPLSGESIVTDEQAKVFITESMPQIIQGFLNIIVGFTNSISTVMTSVIIYGFLFNTFLLYRKSIVQTFHIISPFDKKASALYLERAGMIVRASLLGQFLIAFATAIGCALLLFVFDLQAYFFFFVIIFTLLGMVPLGSGILMIPIIVIAMLMGQFWEGFWVLVIYLVVVCNFDNFIRPKVVPKKANLLPALTTLSTFCGLYYFGILGVVYGPLIAILLITTIDVYTDHQKLAKKQFE